MGILPVLNKLAITDLIASTLLGVLTYSHGVCALYVDNIIHSNYLMLMSIIKCINVLFPCLKCLHSEFKFNTNHILYFTVTLPVLFNATKIGIGRILNIC